MAIIPQLTQAMQTLLTTTTEATAAAHGHTADTRMRPVLSGLVSAFKDSTTRSVLECRVTYPPCTDLQMLTFRRR